METRSETERWDGMDWIGFGFGYEKQKHVRMATAAVHTVTGSRNSGYSLFFCWAVTNEHGGCGSEVK